MSERREKPGGGKINQDAYEAVWEHVNGRDLVYPKERYSNAVFMTPSNFDWVQDGAGTATKLMGIFSERDIMSKVVTQGLDPRTTRIVDVMSTTLRTLAQHPNITAIKDCGGDPAKTQTLIADGQLQVLAGDDANIFTTLALGGTGAIAASGHVHTARLVALMQHVLRGELAAAQALWRPLLPLIEALFAEPNPGPVKALLAQEGWMQAELRSPMTAASAELTARLVALSATLETSPR